MVMCTTPWHRSCLAEWATMGHGAMGTCPALCPEYHVCLGWSRVGLALDVEGIIKGQQPVAAPTHPLSCVSQSESPQESPGGTSHIPISTAGVKVRSGRGLSISIIVLLRRVSVGGLQTGRHHIALRLLACLVPSSNSQLPRPQRVWTGNPGMDQWAACLRRSLAPTTSRLDSGTQSQNSPRKPESRTGHPSACSLQPPGLPARCSLACPGDVRVSTTAEPNTELSIPGADAPPETK